MTEEDDKLIRDCFHAQLEERRKLARMEDSFEELNALLAEVNAEKEKIRVEIVRTKAHIRSYMPRTLGYVLDMSENTVRRIYDQEKAEAERIGIRIPQFGRVYMRARRNG